MAPINLLFSHETEPSESAISVSVVPRPDTTQHKPNSSAQKNPPAPSNAPNNPSSSSHPPAARKRVRYLSQRISASQLQDTLGVSKMSLTQFLTTPTGQMMLNRLASTVHEGDTDEAGKHMLARVWHGVVERSQIANISDNQKRNMRKMLELRYALMSQPRRKAAAAAVSKAVKASAGTNSGTTHDAGPQPVDSDPALEGADAGAGSTAESGSVSHCKPEREQSNQLTTSSDFPPPSLP